MRLAFWTICFAALVVSGASAQEKKSVPPPPKPNDDGPSLEVTMKFIQDKMNDHGAVGYVYTRSNFGGAVFRHHDLMSDVVADATTCTLRATEKFAVQIEVAEGVTYTEGGKAVSGDDLHRDVVETSSSSFKEVASVAVESAEHYWSRKAAEAARPEIIYTHTPAVYNLSLIAAKKDAFSLHSTVSKGKQPRQNSERTNNETTFVFRDEETANRVAKAMLHAVELCGGGNKSEPF
jgi:hypothetical protein